MLEIGSSLAEARQRRGLGLGEVERVTRIRIQQLRALEQERFDLLPPDPYRRSFLREYAEFLGLDGDRYVEEYDRRFRVPEPVPEPPVALGRTARLRTLGGGRRLLGVAISILVVVIGVAAWQLARSPGAAPGTSAEKTTAPQRQTKVPSPVAPLVASTPGARPAAPATLVVRAARGPCWLWVRLGSGSGPTIYQQTLQTGHSARFSLRRPLWIRLGAPWNLDVALGGHRLNLPGQVGNVLVTARGLQLAP
jgi:hypothetical protein